MTRIGASQVFFNIVAQFNAEKLIKDYRSINTVMKAVSLDTFEAILKPVEGLGQAINKITDELGPLQEALGLAAVEFEKFFGSTPAMEAMRDSVMDLGQEFAQTGVEALAAGSRAAQVANLVGRGNVEVLTKLAYTLAEISDLNAEEAQRGIIQLHQQTGMLFGEMNQESFRRLSLQEQQNILVEEGAKALDALNTIANRSVALEGDLVRVMGTFAAQGELVGDSFEFMAAASATLLEAGEEQGTAGRALRMMYARLGGDISGARTEIEKLGFDLTDNEGQMKNMQEVLTELSEKGWSNFTGAQKQNIAQTIAGNRHYVRFIKLMENYDRTMQLAADGARGFDSALGQANRALAQEVNLLKKAQVENENLRAKIGEGLTPFMRGQVEVQNDYLMMTEVLTDSLGGLGVALGRVKGTMQVMGGFIKVGLATQSLGIGFEMFTSVQRQLNGILVANEHLHSKQANYMDYNVRQTATQRDLLAGLQFIQQKINMHSQERRFAESQISYALRDQVDLFKKIDEAEMKVQGLTVKKFALQRKLSAAKKLETVELNAQAGIHERRIARLQYEGAIESNMLENVLSLYDAKSATNNAMMRQYLSDLEAAKNLTADEVSEIRERHRLLEQESSIMQRIKSDNELRFRSTGGGDTMHNERLNPKIRQESFLVLSESDKAAFRARLDDFAGDAAKTFRARFTEAQIKQANKGDDPMRSLLYMKKGEADFDAIYAEYGDAVGHAALKQREFNGEINNYSGYEAVLLKNMNKKVQGGLIQTTRATETLHLAQVDLVESTRRVTSVKNALSAVNAHLTTETSDLLYFEGLDKQMMEKLAPLIRTVNVERDNEVKKKQAAAEITRILTTEEKNLSAEQGKIISKYKQSEKDALKFAEDKSMAFRQMGFAIQNSIGLVGGFIGGPGGAAASMAFMAGNVAMAGKQAAVAGSQIIKMTFDQSVNAATTTKQGFAHAFLSKKLKGTQLAVASTTASLAAMMLPLAAAAAAMYYFYKDAEKTRKELDKINESALNFENIMGSISRDKMIMSNTGLAKSIGLDNMSTGEMLDSGADIESMIKTLQQTAGQYTDEQNIQIENAIEYLNIIRSTNDEMQNTLNDEAFGEAARDASRELDKYSAKFARSFGVGAFDRKAGQDLFDSIGHGYAFETSGGTNASIYTEGNAARNLNSIISFMEQGNKLTLDQIELAEEYFNDDEITQYLRVMNKYAKTQEIVDYNQNLLNEEIATTNTLTGDAADDIKNLTDEIYNFSGAREELFFGGKYGNVTGSLYRTVVKQGVGTLYHKNEVIMTTNFHGFFNEQEAAERITRIVTEVLAQ